MGEFFNNVFQYFFSHYELYMAITMSIVVSFIVFVLNFIKKPIKVLTKKIPNERLRKLANKSIIVIAFLLSVIIWLILSKIKPDKFDFNAVNILISGAFPIVGYALGEGWITKSKATEIQGKIETTVEDGEVTKDELKDLAKEATEEKSGAELLDELLKK